MYEEWRGDRGELRFVQKRRPLIIGIFEKSFFSNPLEALAITNEIPTFRKTRLITLLTSNMTGFHLNENQRPHAISVVLQE